MCVMHRNVACVRAPTNQTALCFCVRACSVRRDHYKGMSREQLNEIYKEQERQRQEKAARRAAEKQADKEYVPRGTKGLQSVVATALTLVPPCFLVPPCAVLSLCLLDGVGGWVGGCAVGLIAFAGKQRPPPPWTPRPRRNVWPASGSTTSR